MKIVHVVNSTHVTQKSTQCFDLLALLQGKLADSWYWTQGLFWWRTVLIVIVLPRQSNQFLQRRNFTLPPSTFFFFFPLTLGAGRCNHMGVNARLPVIVPLEVDEMRRLTVQVKDLQLRPWWVPLSLPPPFGQSLCCSAGQGLLLWPSHQYSRKQLFSLVRIHLSTQGFPEIYLNLLTTDGPLLFSLLYWIMPLPPSHCNFNGVLRRERI